MSRGGFICWPEIVEVSHRVIRASYGNLIKFSYADLKAYAEGLGVEPHKRKHETVERLLASGKATLCASLGT